MGDYYVVVAANDLPVSMSGRTYHDDGGEIVFEQYLKSADLESIKIRAKLMSLKYGKCRIAKLTFIGD
ncbi:MAG: hypothetical protein DRH93_15590 [Deltaproteobacteria bacterium]|nr:MAG: hypothetical protein DRH93_15590 [Deltaproteobacteria bacterium]